jgi:hypothetical protein
MSHFLTDLEFIPEWQADFPQMVGEAGKEAVIMTRLHLSSLGSESPPEFPPNPEEGKGKGGGATSESGFRMAHGKKQLRHSE